MPDDTGRFTLRLRRALRRENVSASNVIRTEHLKTRALLRALAKTSGSEALTTALPLYIALACAEFVFLDGETLALIAERSALARVVTWSTWLLFTLPAARALLASPSTFWLRSLPMRRSHLLVMQSMFLMCGELPWGYVWLRGLGPIAAAAAALAAMGLHAALMTQGLRVARVLAASVLAYAVIGAKSHDVQLGLAMAFTPLAIHDAWNHAAERAHVGSVAWVRPPRLLALFTAEAAILARSHRAVVARGVVVTSLGAAAAHLALRNNEATTLTGRSTVLMSILAPAIIFAVLSLSRPILRTERELVWLLDATRTPHWLRRICAVGLVACFGFALGAPFGAFALAGVDTDVSHLVLMAVKAGLGSSFLAVAVLRVARFNIRGNARDARRIVIAAMGVSAFCALTSVIRPGAVVEIWAAIAALLEFFAFGMPRQHGRPVGSVN